jgi:membrane-associated phospholipid phosphatase
MNNIIFLFFYNFAHQSVIVDKLIVFTAVYFSYIVAFLALIFLFFFLEKKLKWQAITSLILSTGVATLVAKMLKVIIHVDRPFLRIADVRSLFIETGFAFPSGHATFFSALAFSVFFYHKKAGYVFMFFALLIGLARIAGGVHFPVDILAGFVLGGVVAYLLRNV